MEGIAGSHPTQEVDALVVHCLGSDLVVVGTVAAAAAGIAAAAAEESRLVEVVANNAAVGACNLDAVLHSEVPSHSAAVEDRMLVEAGMHHCKL